MMEAVHTSETSVNLYETASQKAVLAVYELNKHRASQTVFDGDFMI